MAAPESPAAPLDRAVGRARTAIDALDAESQTACLRDWKSETLNECAMALRSVLAALDADKRLEEAEALLLDVWDSQHREGWEPTETERSVIDRLGDWRWNNGYDPCNPPMRPYPRKTARREGEKGDVPRG